MWRGGGGAYGNAFITGGTITGVSGVTTKLLSGAIPMINCSSGTMGNNGALSAITALSLTYANCYLWLPAGAIAAGVPAAASWYFAQMSSTTAGTVFNNTFTSGTPTIPSSPTAFATTGPGAFAGATGEVFGPSASVAAGAMGVAGRLIAIVETAQTNNANAKTASVRFTGNAGTQFMNTSIASIATSRNTCHISNRGATNVQYGGALGSAYGNGVGMIMTAPTQAAVDTTAATTVVFSLTKGTVTDNVVLEQYDVDLVS